MSITITTDTPALTRIPVSEASEGMETRHGIITDIVPNPDAGDGYLDVYINDAWVGTVTPRTTIAVYA